MNAYDTAIDVLARVQGRHMSDACSICVDKATKQLSALLAARYPSDCATCGGTGRVGKFGLSENLKVTPKPCPSCRRLLDALGEER